MGLLTDVYCTILDAQPIGSWKGFEVDRIPEIGVFPAIVIKGIFNPSHVSPITPSITDAADDFWARFTRLTRPHIFSGYIVLGEVEVQVLQHWTLANI